MFRSVQGAPSASRKSFSLSPIWRHVQAALRELSPSSSGRPTRARSLMHLEALEPRLLLSASAMVDSGMLTVTGDAAANDVVQIEQTAETATGVIISLTLDGGAAQTFTDITAITVDAAGGDDTITLLSPIRVAATIDGGTGDDTATLTYDIAQKIGAIKC